ncbi:MAG: hypothetical protein PHF05_01820 [Candidatus Izemoplasmatales bacterium]|nr:hypothetical protein [Candidatus Izemoplasmatales bacterium]MDD4069167.1 hypothetical protein [Candidatus Izemoplasmatales bacterium]MDY0139993.1 hypothetical protein [Candidatus Izemoplasmatales bacterium]
MSFIDKIKGLFVKKGKEETGKPDFISLMSMEAKYQEEDYMGAAKDLKGILERYGRRKRKNHRYKGREFIYFILSNKHKDLKNAGYNHWENLNQFIKLNQTKVYPYHKKNLREAMDFFEKEIKGLKEIKFIGE